MKRTLHFLLLISFSFNLGMSFIQAQCYVGKSKCRKKKLPYRFYSKNQMDLKIGTGLLPSFFLDGGITHFRPTTIGGDYFLSENFSLGGIYGYSIQETEKFYKQIQMKVALKNELRYYGLRALAHYTKPARWTFYGGMMTGVNQSNYSGRGEQGMENTTLMNLLAHRLRIHPKEVDMTFSGVVGASYNFCRFAGAWAEMSGGVSLVTTGVSLRIF